VICLDNQSNGLLLSLYYEHHVSKTLTNDTITIPPRTYESVPCQDVSKKNNTNMELTYPNLSVFPIYKK
jgi:hypothetical protein